MQFSAILCHFGVLLRTPCLFVKKPTLPNFGTPWLTVRCAGSPPLCSQPNLLAIPPMVIWHPRISHATIFPSSQVATSIIFWAHSSLTPSLKVGKWKYVPAALLNVWLFMLIQPAFSWQPMALPNHMRLTKFLKAGTPATQNVHVLLPVFFFQWCVDKGNPIVMGCPKVATKKCLPKAQATWDEIAPWGVHWWAVLPCPRCRRWWLWPNSHHLDVPWAHLRPLWNATCNPQNGSLFDFDLQLFLPNPGLNKECLQIISYNIIYLSISHGRRKCHRWRTHASQPDCFQRFFTPLQLLQYHDISWHIMTYHDIHDLQLVGKGSPTCSNSLPRFDLDGRSCGLSYSSDRFALLPDQASLPQL